MPPREDGCRFIAEPGFEHPLFTTVDLRLARVGSLGEKARTLAAQVRDTSHRPR